MIEWLVLIVLGFGAIALVLAVLSRFLGAVGDLYRHLTTKPLPPDPSIQYEDLAGDD